MYREAVDYILKIRRFTKKNSLENTKRLLEILGNPQEKMKIIHVAGTNGKGSVCAYLNRILLKDKKTVGLFTSPHLVNINERIKINNIDINNEEFCKSFDAVMSAISMLPEEQYCHPSFFEFIFLMAMVAFKNAEVEYVILETGLGGRLDATNAIQRPIAAVITKIDLDHTDILGDTIDKIAFEKAGIIKENVPLIFLDDHDGAARVIQKAAYEKSAHIYSVKSGDIKITRKDDKMIDFCIANGYYESNVYTINSVADYQTVNASIAVRTAQVIGIKDEGILSDGLRSTVWEGRMEQIFDNVYIDGAHNPGAFIALADTINKIKKDKKLYLMFSVVNDKDYSKIIQCICDKVSPEAVVLSPIDTDRGMDMDILKDKFISCGMKHVYTAGNVEEGFNTLMSMKQSDIAVCAGSLYLVGSIKKMLRRNDNA